MATTILPPDQSPALSREVLGGKLFDAVAIIDSVALALKAHIGTDWPASIPYFPDALKTAASMITDAADEIDFCALNGCAIQDTGEVAHDSARALADRARRIVEEVSNV